MGKIYDKVTLIGYVRYKDNNNRILLKNFTLGYMEAFIASCALDLDIILDILKKRYERFLSRKENKNQYELIEIYLRIYKSPDKYKDYTLYMSLSTLCKGE